MKDGDCKTSKIESWVSACESGSEKQTSQRSLLFRQNVNRTEAEWVHFLDGYRKALIEFL